jgi:AcrR family transcriptional regulator
MTGRPLDQVPDRRLGAAQFATKTPFPSDRVLRATAELLRTGGIDAVTTRAVATAAGIQVPRIYRQFGDKDGLLDAVTHHVVQQYLRGKRQVVGASNDPVGDLRQLWNAHIEFGLDNPDCYVLIYSQPRPGRIRSAASETVALLQQAIARAGDQGRLRMSVRRATHIFHAGAIGVVLTHIAIAPDRREPELSAVVQEKTLSTILHDTSDEPNESSDLRARVVALGLAMRTSEDISLTSAESALLAEWLNLLADHKVSASTVRGEAAPDRLRSQSTFEDASARAQASVDQAVELTREALGTVSSRSRAVGEGAANLVGIDLPKKAPAAAAKKVPAKKAPTKTAAHPTDLYADRANRCPLSAGRVAPDTFSQRHFVD